MSRRKPEKAPYKRTRPNTKKRVRGAHYVSPAESRKITGFGTSLTYQLLRSGQMPGIRINGHWWVPRAELLTWLESKRFNRSAA
jgi:hypothetical protein